MSHITFTSKWTRSAQLFCTTYTVAELRGVKLAQSSDFGLFSNTLHIYVYIGAARRCSDTWFYNGFIAARCYKRGLCRHAVSVSPCVSVCVSVTFVNSDKTNKHIFKNFSPSDSQAILIFRYQTVGLWQYSDGNSPNGGVECRWGRQKSRFWANIWLHCICCEAFQRQVQ